MSRDAFLKLAAKIRLIPSSPAFDILTTKVVVRTRVWSVEVGVGDHVDTDLEILPRPRVREQGDNAIVIDRIQPRYSGGGYTPQQLVPPNPLDNVTETFWLLTAVDGVTRKYTTATLITDKALHYGILLEGRDVRYAQ
jgi:hypothetical protein